MKTELIRILGVDTSLRSSGVAMIESDGLRHRALSYGRIYAPASWSRTQCLKQLRERMEEILSSESPQQVAIEGIFHCKNVKTAFILGEARGTVISTCAAQDLPIFEYAPRRVKQSLVGRGSADKQQVAEMVKRLFGLPELPQNDAADALAIASCHANQLRSPNPTEAL